MGARIRDLLVARDPLRLAQVRLAAATCERARDVALDEVSVAAGRVAVANRAAGASGRQLVREIERSS